MRQNPKPLLASLLAACVVGCSDPTGSDGSSTGGSGSGGGQNGGTTATSGGNAGTSTGGKAGGSGFTREGICGKRNNSSATTTTFEGYEEHFLIDDGGFGSDICVVRFDVQRVGPGPSLDGCEGCLWSHEVRMSNPQVMLNTEGVCGNSELGLSDEKLAAMDGTTIIYAFSPEAVGHVSLVMTYANAHWDIYTNGTWDPESGMLRFDWKNGFCGY